MKNERTVSQIPKSDLSKLQKEVLSLGRSAALPKNLSDLWLKMIARDLAMTHKAVHFGPDIHSHQSLKAPLLLVMALLKIDYVSEDAEEGYSPEQLLIYMRRFERAIYEELIGRVTGVFINRYSIDSIFAAPLQ